MARQQAGTLNPVARWFGSIRLFFEEVQAEMEKVTWPTKDDLRSSTAVVMMMLCIVAAIVGSFDFVFQKVVFWLLQWA